MGYSARADLQSPKTFWLLHFFDQIPLFSLVLVIFVNYRSWK